MKCLGESTCVPVCVCIVTFSIVTPPRAASDSIRDWWNRYEMTRTFLLMRLDFVSYVHKQATDSRGAKSLSQPGYSG